MVKIKTPMEDNSHSNKELIPSVVYFPQGEKPAIGYRAKHMIQFQPSKIVKSIKTFMGSPSWQKEFNGQKYKPVDISTIILQHLMRGIKKHYDHSIDDIVVTVPASFDMDMRADTLEAARRAGINTLDDDGTPRDILLDEPYACLLDFIEQQRRGEIDFVDFTKEKIVLVYDLGGGTLDVSIHAVQSKYDSPFPKIIDLGISRYTYLGGDVLDECVSEFLFKEYLKKNDMYVERYEKIDVDEAKLKLIEKVEQWKKLVTSRAEERLLDNIDTDIINISDKILVPQLLDMKNFTRKLSLKEYKEILSEFFAEEIKFPTERTINNPIPSDDNLILPILDVLQKAYKKKGEIFNPDLIILSGGMTRVHVIQDRIKNFFGKDVHVIPDPDRAVSRGAAIYHYYMHKGYKPISIIAESILIKVNEPGGKKTTLEELVPAGSILPFNQEFSFIVGEEGKTSVRMPFFRTDLKHKLIDRTFNIGKKSKKDTEVKAKVNVDTRKIVTFTAWLAKDPEQKVIVEIDPTKPEIPKRKIKKGLKQIEELPIPIPASQKKYNPSVIDTIFSNINRNEKADWKDYDSLSIINAQNINVIVQHALKKLKQKKGTYKYSEMAKARLLCDFFGKVAVSPYIHKHFSNILLDMQKDFIQYVRGVGSLADYNVSEIHNRVRYCIETIGKISLIDDNRKVIDFFKEILEEPVFYKIRGPIFISMGKLTPDNEVSDNLLKYINTNIVYRPNKTGLLLSLLWALGRQAQRRIERPVDINKFINILPDLFDLIIDSQNPEIIIHATYCVVEACARCDDLDNEAPSKSIKHALKTLETKRQSFRGIKIGINQSTEIKRKLNAIKWLELGMRFLKREETVDDEATLLELRDKN